MNDQKELENQLEGEVQKFNQNPRNCDKLSNNDVSMQYKSEDLIVSSGLPEVGQFNQLLVDLQFKFARNN